MEYDSEAGWEGPITCWPLTISQSCAVVLQCGLGTTADCWFIFCCICSFYAVSRYDIVNSLYVFCN